VSRQVRPLALALIRRGDEVLVEEGWDSAKQEKFHRLLGGGIDFGERGADSLRRELREELGSEADMLRHIATLENLFTYEGEPGHEIALIYECTLRDEALYSRDSWETHEDTAREVITHRLAWKPLDAFRAGREILYPDGALSLLDGA
jgi:ADP-ribose pyrophosphatase YjhB (NUDIX family)